MPSTFKLTSACRVILALGALSDGWAENLRWTFDEEPPRDAGQSGLVDGKKGKAVVVRPDPVITRSVSSRFLKEGALSFYYRPSGETKGDFEILRLGSLSLRYLKRRLAWYSVEDEESANDRWIPTHSYLSEEKFVLIEIGWSKEQRSVIFVDGLQVTWMGAFEPPPTEQQTVPLTLKNGIFDELQLVPDFLASGARYTGPLFLHTFESGSVHPFFYQSKTDVRLVPGFNGSKHALSSHVGNATYERLLRNAHYRVTPDMWVCMAVKTSNGSFTRCMVRAWPKMEKHPNHWLRKKLPPGEWHAVRTPLERFSLKYGSLVSQISCGSMGREERWLATDNFCIFRGKDTTPPDKVEGLTATVTDGIRLNWKPARDDICIAGYRVFWSNVERFELSKHETIATTLNREFTHRFITHPGNWYYTVAAVDLFGNIGKPAVPVKVKVE